MTITHVWNPKTKDEYTVDRDLFSLIFYKVKFKDQILQHNPMHVYVVLRLQLAWPKPQ